MSARPLTPTQARMLDALTRLGPRGPGALGDELWGPARGTVCSAPFARLAGKVLNGLRALGLVAWGPVGRGPDAAWLWSITEAGRSALAATSLALADLRGAR